jgi:hypothetical protein
VTEPDDDPTGALVAFVRGDYEATHRALDGFVANGNQSRAIGIAAWGVVYAAAVAAHSWVLSLLAGGLVVPFMVADGYFGTLYREALQRLRDIEGLLGDHHNALGIYNYDRKYLDRATAALEQHGPGVHLAMKPVNEVQKWWWWVPRPIRVTWFYAVILVIAAVTAAVLGSAHDVTCRNGREGQQPCVVLTTPAASRTVTVTVPTPALTATPATSATPGAATSSTTP